jgi:excisionase family DNA binding protein
MIKIGDVVAYDLNELSKILHLSERTIRKYINEGRLLASKVGRKYYITEETLEEYFALSYAEWE